MPLVLDGSRPLDGQSWIGAAGFRPTALDGIEGGCIEIGLVNNMPDTALQATERQFMSLLARASRERTVRVHLFSLPSVVRGEAAAAHIRASYSDLDSLDRTPLDALIVTGCEPRAASLADEPYWDSLTRLVDWAERNTVSTLWSCLAAHAAALYLDGVGRHRLPAKRLGIYTCEPVAHHSLLTDAPARLQVPHSRWNDLREADLVAHGYQILTRSPEAGVNLFAKQGRSLFLFFQGHPEYDADSIAREYRRDIARYLRGEQPNYPGQPDHYFDDATGAALEAIRALALADRKAVGLRDLPRSLGLRPGLQESWQATVVPVFANWLEFLARSHGQTSD